MIHTAGLNLTPQTTPFAKEPDFGKRALVRGTFKFGNTTEQFLPFVWDYTKGKLYLDLNRNGDLSDDPEGVLSCKNPNYGSGSRYISQVFTKVPLTFNTPLGTHRALVDLQLHSYNQNPGASVWHRSFWEGKLTLQGKEWQLGYIENLTAKFGSTDGAWLLVRPWDSRKRSFSTTDGSLAAFSFCRNLFFAGQAWQLDCASVREGESPTYRIELKEQRPELGELNLSGKFIQRMILTARKAKTPYTVVLDSPEQAVRIPVGAYGAPQVHLQQGSAEANRDVNRYGAPDTTISVVVNATNAVSLATGGPLTNTVAVNRRGRELSLNYRLVGARGEAYSLPGPRKEPEFAVYKGDKKLASGKFAFG